MSSTTSYQIYNLRKPSRKYNFKTCLTVNDIEFQVTDLQQKTENQDHNLLVTNHSSIDIFFQNGVYLEAKASSRINFVDNICFGLRAF